MKNACSLLAVILTVPSLFAQEAPEFHADSTRPNCRVTDAPLRLFTNGAGRIFPFHDGQELQVGRTYVLRAVPDRGFVFSNWNQVNVFTLTTSEIDYNTSPPITNLVTSVDLSPLTAATTHPWLSFKMEPVTVLFNTNGNSLTLSIGWQANFVPRERKPAFEPSRR